ncbi:Hint domain-containing protein [Sinisalibacter lacisalsi]|uniref:Hedgehog/Intein (Hint) domain-containing protein n=1 Tax=Sinisalibacter lacisalsi TaxID=1526570 RepID=A0ABQ1QTZ9_9RHOB|nr:Hint domain-containing protein [Sinisalibacter lacisalsi]GGD41455.1 hypothetical protein GCM10011358_26680 [Sinisalibacter lacisalsi]
MSQAFPGRARSIRVPLSSCRSGFGTGTGVLTTEGEMPVEFLEPGDRIVTWDRGAIRLARIVVRLVPRAQVLRVRPSVTDPAGAGRDFLISAQTRLLLRDWRAAALFGKHSALVEAGRLADGAHIARLGGADRLRLFQLHFDDAQHLVQIAGGRFQVASAKMPARTAA